MAEILSHRRKQILDYIKKHLEENGYPPTVREIGEAVSLSSPSTVHAHLRVLKQQGLIESEGALTRTIRLKTESGSLSQANVVNLPIVGRVAAGTPILAQQDIEGYFGVPREMIPDGQGFLLKVRGDSMVNAGINDGDFVVVREQSTADNGDIVVALLEGEGTVKRIFRDNGYIRLQPENPNLTSIVSREVEIVGKVVGIFRRLY